MMGSETCPGFRDLVENWIVKKSAASAPQRMGEDEVEALAKASIETLRQRATGEGELPWGALEALSGEWFVQREKGRPPSRMGEGDYVRFVGFVLEGLTRPVIQVVERGPEERSSEEGSVEVEAVAEGEDPYRFAREHLARCL